MTTDIAAVRWEQQVGEQLEDYEYDGGNSSSRLFERSRIKALAGNNTSLSLHTPYWAAITPVRCPSIRASTPTLPSSL
jgi:spectrin beta